MSYFNLKKRIMKHLLLFVGILFLFSCGDGSKALFTAPDSATISTEITVKFPSAVNSTEEDRMWIAIVEKSKPETDWGVWKYVEDQATSIKLTCPDVAGDYEIRLHDNYPKESSHLIYKQDLTIK